MKNSEPHKPSTLTERLAEKLGLSASAKTVFAEPIERDGVTVVPVARVRGGFGGNSGMSELGENGGGGGGFGASPLGYIEIKDGQTSFKRIADPAALVPLVVAGGFVGYFLLRALNKLTRR
jgi:uncharacterized spore protein YtfJ